MDKTTKYGLIVAGIAFFIYLAIILSPKEVTSIEIIDEKGNILAHESLQTRTLALQAFGDYPLQRNRLPEGIQTAIANPNASQLILTMALSNDGNVPINVTLSNAMLVGGFR